MTYLWLMGNHLYTLKITKVPGLNLWGTPWLILDQFDVKVWPLNLFFKFTCWYLLLKNCENNSLVCGLLNIHNTHTLTPLFSAVITRTHTGSCWPWKGPLDTNRWCRLEAPVAWGSTLDARSPSLRSFVSRLATQPVR
jgi:hypothetical protein